MLLEVKDLSVHYGQAVAIQNVSICVPEKSVVALVGPNGSGKSTLLKSISGLKSPTSGVINFKGTSLLSCKPSQIVRLGITHSPEGRRPFPEMTVTENLIVGGYILSGSSCKSQIDKVFKLFPRLKERKSQLAGTLSGGELQMLAIARALIVEPSLLLLDEPSLGLAPKIVEDIGEVIKAIKEAGVSTLLVEQNVDLVQELADTIYVLDSGTTVFNGTFKEIMEKGDLYKTYLGI